MHSDTTTTAADAAANPYDHAAFVEAGFEEHELDCDDCTVRWWLSDPDPDALLVVCTHGGGMDHRMFAPQVPALAPRWRLLVYDVRGHGASRCPASSFSLEAATRDLLALIDAAGARDAVLVGHSFGGTIAQLAMREWPERVRAFVGIGASCMTMWPTLGMRLRQAVNPLALSILGDERIRTMFAENAGVSPQVREYAAQTLSALSDEMFEAVVRTGFGRPREIPDYRIGVPVLLLQGKREAYKTFLAASKAWVARDKGRLIVVPDAGHNANQDAPEFVNRELESFLSGIAASGS